VPNHTVDELLGEMPLADGFPRPDWTAIAKRVREGCGDADRSSAWTELGRAWLARMQRALGTGYQLSESKNLLLLGPWREPKAKQKLALGERTISTMSASLPGIARTPGQGKLPCVVFTDPVEFHTYTSAYSPGIGPQGVFAGSCLRLSYCHLCVMDAGEDVLVHELAHACLVGCWLPVWLEEGIVCLGVQEVLGDKLGAETGTADAQRKYWAPKGLAEFWWGAGHRSPDQGQSLSYSLSQILVGRLLARGRPDFLTFVRHASRRDCGESASVQVYGTRLTEWAAAVLGPGDWGWAPARWTEHLRLAEVLLVEGDYRAALFELRTAVEKEPANDAALNALAWLLATCPDEGVRDGNEAIAVATSACELTQWESDAIVDTLACAHAEVGDFSRAITLARQASLRPHAHTALVKSHLRAFEQGHPWREHLAAHAAALRADWTGGPETPLPR
jgi:hypothetical protein